MEVVEIARYLDGPLLIVYILAIKIVEGIKAKYEHLENMARIAKGE